MDSPEISPQDSQTGREVNAQSPQPESSAQQPQNATPINYTRLPDQPPPSKDTAENGKNNTANQQEETTAAQPDQEAGQSSQSEPQGTAEQQEQEETEKRAQLATQINLLLTQAIALVSKSQLPNEKKGELENRIKSLQEDIKERGAQMTYSEIGQKITEIGKSLDHKPLQILGLELQMYFGGEENREALEEQINALAQNKKEFKNQLPRLYNLFTGEEFDENSPNLIDIATGLVRALQDEEAKKALLDRAQENGFDRKSIEDAINQLQNHQQAIQQAITSSPEQKRSTLKAIGALGLFGIIVLLFTLIRSALAGEREQSPI